MLASRLAGRTFRFTWTAGPGVSVTQEYRFDSDGTVSYAIIEPNNRPEYFTPSRYGAFEVAPDIFIVACLDASGYALTVTMNFREKHLHGFATDAAQWYPVQGHFVELSQYQPALGRPTADIGSSSAPGAALVTLRA